MIGTASSELTASHTSGDSARSSGSPRWSAPTSVLVGRNHHVEWDLVLLAEVFHGLTGFVEVDGVSDADPSADVKFLGKAGRSLRGDSPALR